MPSRGIAWRIWRQCSLVGGNGAEFDDLGWRYYIVCLSVSTEIAEVMVIGSPPKAVVRPGGEDDIGEQRMVD